MTATLDDTVADLRRANEALQRSLDERTAELRENNERYALVSQAVAEGIYDWNVEQNTLFVSPRLMEIFGFDGPGLNSEDWFRLVHAADRERYRSAIRNCFKGESPRVACEYRILVRSGEYRWVEDHGLPIRNGAGRAFRLVGAVSDITERKESERALREALDQQTATAEVLRVINSSPGDLTPVFDAMLQKALQLCDASFGDLAVFDGTGFRSAAARGYRPGVRVGSSARSPAPTPGMALYSLIHGEDIIHISDITADEIYRSGNLQRRRLADEFGARTAIWVALRNDVSLFGAFVIYRTEVRPFTDTQIALLQNFAAQAVIAMENARLITETREALDQQTATTEVLQVINSSPGDLAPVFDAMLEKAIHLCEASFGNMFVYDGTKDRSVAVRGAPQLARWLAERGAVHPAPGSLGDRLTRGEHVVHIIDAAKDPAYVSSPTRRAVVGIGGFRTLLGVALRKGDALLGGIVVYRKEVRPFTEKQIALLQSFAAQAVIAMENARLITETREALEQQQAIAEMLGVINSSPGDLAPVFDKLVQTATRLCEAEMANLARREGDVYRPIAAFTPFAASSEATTFLHGLEIVPGRGTTAGRALLEKRVVHIADIVADPEYVLREAVSVMNYRTTLGVPLLREGEPIGVMTVARSRVAPFTERQIALVENFAAQAVIAMENARLIAETREALEQQTATAEVLQVINSSPGDLAPVFDAMLEKGLRLCEAKCGNIAIYEGERFNFVALSGHPEFDEWARQNGPGQPRPGTTMERMIRGENVIHLADLTDDEGYRSGTPVRHALVEIGGFRTLLCVALRKDQRLLGMFHIYRQEVRPFSDKQIALLQNFAAQAVIAMENARLLDQIRQRQAELRVTFDNMADGVVMFDEDLRLTAWNRNFLELLDLPDALLAERPSYADYLRILAERGEFGTDDTEAELTRRLENTDQELRLERTRPNGQVIEVRRNAVPDGGFVLIYSDITERKRSEAEIRAARDAAEATLRDLRAAQANLIQAEKMASLGQLTAGIAHEIKNPLNFVNNFADLSGELLKELQDSAAPGWAALDDDKRTEIDETMVMLTGNLEKIAEHGKRADNIVKSMLEHSRGVSGERREVDLNGLVEEALNLAYHGARAQDQTFNITMERDFDPALRPMGLAPQEITRVFLNLFGNGFYAANKRAHGNGDPTFHPTLTVSTRDLGDVVEVKVRDNGTGIPPEIREQLFQPFFTTKPTGEGTGLGLSISYDIVTQQHGGTITVESEPGEFTEFIVRLPRAHRARTAGAASWA